MSDTPCFQMLHNCYMMKTFNQFFLVIFDTVAQKINGNLQNIENLNILQKSTDELLIQK